MTSPCATGRTVHGGNAPGSLDLVPGGIAAETRQTMENIKTVVEQFGSSMDRVVKTTVWRALCSTACQPPRDVAPDREVVDERREHVHE